MNRNTSIALSSARSFSDEKLTEIVANRVMYNPQLVAECEQEIAIRAAARPLFEKCQQMSNEELLKIVRNPDTYSPEAVYCSQTILCERQKQSAATATMTTVAKSQITNPPIDELQKPDTLLQSIVNKIVSFFESIFGTHTPKGLSNFKNLSQKSWEIKKACLKNTAILFGCCLILYTLLDTPSILFEDVIKGVFYNFYGTNNIIHYLITAASFIIVILKFITIITLVGGTIFMWNTIDASKHEFNNDDYKKVRVINFTLLSIVTTILIAQYLLVVATPIMRFLGSILIQILPRLISTIVIPIVFTATWIVIFITSMNLKKSTTLPDNFQDVFGKVMTSSIIMIVGYFLYYNRLVNYGELLYSNPIIVAISKAVLIVSMTILICAGALMFTKAWKSLK